MSVHLPAVNAALNGSAAVLLLAGLVAIKSGRREAHKRFMFAALAASTAFLACYLYYHATHGSTKFNATGVARTLYLALLVSHTLLAVVNLPMVLRTFWLAHKERWVEHRKAAKWTFPVWLYVSVTGVAVYVVLYHFNPQSPLP